MDTLFGDPQIYSAPKVKCPSVMDFIYVNRGEKDLKDLKRYRKCSFYWFKKVIESNGEEL